MPVSARQRESRLACERSAHGVGGLFRSVSRNDPAFIACVLIAGLNLHYVPRGVDYFPSPEMCMVNGYMLLATAIATFVLRPRSTIACVSLCVAAFLSIRTIASVCLFVGILSNLAVWLLDSEPTGYLLLFEGFLSATHWTGVSDRSLEVSFNIVITGVVFHLCTQAFVRTPLRLSAATFLIAYAASFTVINIAVLIVGPDSQFAQPAALFMMLQSILYWWLIPFTSKRFQPGSDEATA
jgi:hypothetical protein